MVKFLLGGTELVSLVQRGTCFELRRLRRRVCGAFMFGGALKLKSMDVDGVGDGDSD